MAHLAALFVSSLLLQPFPGEGLPPVLLSPSETGERAYDPSGRRDPFAPLVGGPAKEPPKGVADIPWQELTLVGILADGPGGPVALFHGGPRSECFFVRPGDRFRNGTLREIVPERGAVIVSGEGAARPGGERSHEIRLHPAGAGE